MPEESEQIFQFIVDTFKISNAPYNIINSELIMAQCQVAVPRSFFTPARTENLNLQLVCKPDQLNKYPGSELVIKGSYRLQWLIEGIRKRGLITCGTFPYELDPRKIQREITGLLPKKPDFFFEQPSLTFHPELLVNFKVILETDEKVEELHSLGINLVDGQITSSLMTELANKKIAPHPPKKNLEKRRISYREAFGSLLNNLKWMLQNRDSQWVETAKSRWKEEVNYLEVFYREENNSEEDELGFYRRMAEVYRKFRPVVKIQIINVGLLYLPVVRYTLESFNGCKIPDLVYNPVSRKVAWRDLSQIPIMV